MKAFIIVLTLILANINLAQDNVEKTIATFEEFKDGVSYFIDKDGYSVEFEKIDNSVLEKFDLKSTEFKGKEFEISYTTETDVDDEDEEISISKIVALKLL